MCYQYTNVVGICEKTGSDRAKERKGTGSSLVGDVRMGEILLFDEPAASWEEALPLGNGFLGAMIYGKMEKELIELNEDSLWTGAYLERRNPDACKKNIDRIREEFEKGNVAQAQLMAEQNLFSLSPHSRHYQPLGQLWIQHHEKENMVKYQRKLDLTTAVYSQKYRTDTAEIEVEAFVSYPKQAFIYHVKNDANTGMNFDIYLTRRDTRSGKTVSYLDQIECDHNVICISGYNGNKQDGIEYAMCASVQTKGGSIQTKGSRLVVEGAQEAVVIVTGRTTYRSESPKQWCIQKIREVQSFQYETIKKEHILDYQQYYNRMHLELGDSKSHERTVKDRMKEINTGKLDADFISLYFNYGRYLLISSSRQGSLPANLQGIWNHEFEPSWGSKYTININLEMNYWICEKTGLSELHMPLMEHMKTMLPRGKKTAKEIYGVDGVCAHHVTDIWGDCNPMDYNAASTIWPYGFVWLCLHIIEHYRYTRDLEFLKSYFNILIENVKFLCGYMYKSGEYYATGPSVSPENSYMTKKGETASVCISPTMDIEIIREFFSEYLAICNELEIEYLCDEVKEHIQKLPPLKIGKYGQIMEWQEDYEECEPGHRHVSQLFALYPGTQIRMDKTPELAHAAAMTLKRRLENGGGHTGWSCAWMIHFFARLQDKQNAWMMLNKLFANSTQDNLLDTCPPFQIDGNFGGANAVLEMLVQEYEDLLILLPSVPEEMSRGSMTNLYLRCGGRLNMKWRESKIEELQISCTKDIKLTLSIPGEIRHLSLKKGEVWKYEGVEQS